MVPGSPTGGTFQLGFNGVAQPVVVPWNSTAEEMRRALEDLPDTNPGDVSVSGGRPVHIDPSLSAYDDWSDLYLDGYPADEVIEAMEER